MPLHASFSSSFFTASTHALCAYMLAARRHRFQLEVPEDAVKYVPGNWEFKTQQKNKCRRYWNKEIKALFKSLLGKEETLEAAQKDVMRRTFAAFDSEHDAFSRVASAVGSLDALQSLAAASESMGLSGKPVVRPTFVRKRIQSSDGKGQQQQASIMLRSMRHPCVAASFESSGSDFVPNDTVLGVTDAAAEKAAEDENNPDGSATTLLLTVGVCRHPQHPPHPSNSPVLHPIKTNVHDRGPTWAGSRRFSARSA